MPGVLELELSRPHKRHALDAQLLAALADTLESLADEVHIVTIVAQGPTFCAGADLQWMREVPQKDGAAIPDDIALLERVFVAMAAAPQVILAVVQGAAIGGGAGLAAAADLVLATEEASFVFPEVRLGLVAAVIAPYVLARMGPAATRAALLTAERIDAARAQALGLANFVVAPAALTQEKARIVQLLQHGGPRAHAQTKRMLQQLPHQDAVAQRHGCRKVLLEARRSAEGQAGMAAFFARVPPPWAPT